MKVTRLSAVTLDVPLFKPFGISGGAQVTANQVLVTVELEGGAKGRGEAAPFPAFNGETQAMALEAVERSRRVVEGEDARRLRPLAAAIRGTAQGSASARCAIETALVDAVGRAARLPAWAFFGGAEARLESDVTIPTGSVEEARSETIAWRSKGFRRFKVKVGGAGAKDDLARLVAIHEASAGGELMLDGNAGLTASDALDLLSSLRARGITPILFEQPTAAHDLGALAEVTKRGGVPVCADESCGSAADVMAIARLGAASSVNVKLMKSGVVEALAIVEAAKAAGLGLMIGGMVEARLAMGMSACFAAGLGGFSYVDLDTPLFLAEDPFEGGYEQAGPRLDVSRIEAGHGVQPKIK